LYLRTYEYIVTLAEFKNYTKASEALYISQPSLSKFVTNLENKLGMKLFERDTNYLRLTYAGELFVETAYHILDVNNNLLNQLRDIEDLKKGRVIVGIPRYRGAMLLPSILPIFYKRYPGIEVSIIEGSSLELEELAVQWKTDITLLNLPISSDKLVYNPIATEEILVALPPTHPLRNQTTEFPKHLSNLQTINLSELRNDNFILRRKYSRLRQIADELFMKAGFRPKVLLESDNMQTILNLVVKGLGITFIPNTWAKVFTAPLYFHLEIPSASWMLVTAYRKGKQLSKASKAFIKVAKEVLTSI